MLQLKARGSKYIRSKGNNNSVVELSPTYFDDKMLIPRIRIVLEFSPEITNYSLSKNMFDDPNEKLLGFIMEDIRKAFKIKHKKK